MRGAWAFDRHRLLKNDVDARGVGGNKTLDKDEKDDMGCDDVEIDGLLCRNVQKVSSILVLHVADRLLCVVVANEAGLLELHVIDVL